ncbi:MAG: protein kinase [Polyangiaceae bacterium]|nr:protein kinase [Polyangiaceae bacterium]
MSARPGTASADAGGQLERQPVERHPFKPGDVFEKYQIVNLIGRGGTAFVYQGYQEFLDRHVAIKVIPGQASQSDDFRRRARAEATVLSRLRHPNVVRVFDAGVSDDGAFIYIVMEKLEGRTLREVLYALGALSVPEVLLVGAQICDAVEAAHRLNVIHRDLKPENIFIESGNHAIVLDFGIAKFRGAGCATTAKHRWQGTALYMSPEHLQGREVTERCDIYALGMMLYEALSGGHPCLNGIESPTIQDIAWIQIGHVPPLLTQVVPTIPDYVARIIQRAIAKLPEHRYGSMLELGVALRDAERLLTLACRERRHITPSLRELVTETNTRLGTKVMAIPMAPRSRAENMAQSATASSVLFREQAAAPPDAANGSDATRSDAPSRGNTLRIAAPVVPHPSSLRSEPPPPTPSSRAERPPAIPQASPRYADDKRQRVRPTRRSKIRIVALGCAMGLGIAVPVGILVGLSRRADTPAALPSADATPSSATSNGDRAVVPERSAPTDRRQNVEPIAVVQPKKPAAPAAAPVSPSARRVVSKHPPKAAPLVVVPVASPTGHAPPRKASAPENTGLLVPGPEFDESPRTETRMPKSGL